jgi:hypothetical protein
MKRRGVNDDGHRGRLRLGIAVLLLAAALGSAAHGQVQQVPSIAGAVAAVTGNATGTTGTVTGTLAAAANKVTYICGFEVDAIGGTAAVGPVIVAGVIGSSMVFQGSATAAGGPVAKQNFRPCVPASAPDSAITITTTADGTATAVDVNSWGFQQ